MKMQLFKGRVNAPVSKSSSLRALVCCALSFSHQQYVIRNISNCDDVKMGIEVIKKLRGFECRFVGADLFINATSETASKPGKKLDSLVLDVGECGFLARVFSSLSTYFSQETTITGIGTILERELGISDFVSNLNLVSTSSQLPVTIKGEVSPGNYTLKASNSSQFISGLLFLLPLLESDSQLTLQESVSKPYLELTLHYLKSAGIKFTTNSELSEIAVTGNQSYEQQEFTPESDWSSLSYLIVLALLNGNLTIENLNDRANLPDRALLKILQEVGGSYEFINPTTLQVYKSDYQGFTFDLTDNPDLAPLLAALAIGANSPTQLSNCYRLRHKESDRLKAIIELLKALKVKHSYVQDKDILTIFPTKLNGGKVKTFNDHRVAMTALVLNVISSQPIEIDNYDCIGKSYPNFITDLKSLGVRL